MNSLHADEAFVEHYQLSHDPFAARVPGFKFFPAQRKPVLGQLHHLARYSQLLLVVTGPKGSGKTLLRQALVASTNKQAVQNVVVSARGAVEAGGVLRLISQGLNVPQADVRAVLERVAQLAATGQEVYLLVDDAELLDDAGLDVMLALANGSADARAHVFLFAQADLLPRLELFADGAECFHAIDLQPYTEEETREYLAQRLDGAGQGVELFSDRQVADIHLASAGWPGAINQIARETLIDAMLSQRGAAQRPSAGFKLPIKHLIALVVVAIGVAGAWMMQGRTEAPAAPPAVTQLSLDGAAQPVPAEPAVAESADAAKAGPKVNFAGSSQPLPLPLVGEAQPVIREPLARAGGLPEGEESGADDAAMPANESGAVAPVPTAAPVAGAVAKTPVAVAPVAAPSVPAVPAAAVPGAPSVAAVAPVKSVVSAPTAPVKSAPAPAPAKPVVKAPVKPAAPAVSSTKVVSAPAAGSGWYKAQPGGNYVVQVLGTGVEANAQAFVRQQGAEYRYFTKVLQGKSLYVVTYGNFSSRAAAQAAIKGLPAKVQASKPWPRTIASVQQEMK